MGMFDRNPMEPKLPSDYATIMYIPVYSLDLGVTWKALDPQLSSRQAKIRLKSVLPSGAGMKEHRFDKLRCGVLLFNLANIKHDYYLEFVPDDFVSDATA